VIELTVGCVADGVDPPEFDPPPPQPVRRRAAKMHEVAAVPIKAFMVPPVYAAEE
jgi:hypothetical protein